MRCPFDTQLGNIENHLTYNLIHIFTSLNIDNGQLLTTSLGVQVLVVVSGSGPDLPDNHSWNNNVQDLCFGSSENVEESTLKRTLQWRLSVWRNGVLSDSRVLNNIDNEELIPAVDFHDLLHGWEVEGGLSKVSSETDKAYFDQAGRRLVLGKHPMDGIEDEYVPDFKEFNFRSWFDDAVLDEDRLFDELHSQVPPISIKNQQVSPKPVSRLSLSPERDKDRVILSSLPSNFLSLSFSERKKLINKVLPESLQNDADYKNHITKLIRRNSISGSSPAQRFTNSFSLHSSSVHSAMSVADNYNQKGSLVLGKWRLGRIIGRGAYGIIRSCTDLNDNEKAMKVINVHGSAELIKRFKTESLMWSLLHHENILPLFDFKFTSKSFFLLTQKCDAGSLFDCVKRWEMSSDPERLSSVVSYLTDICSGLEYMHSLGISHGDVKLENCLLSHGRVVLCDFGMASFFSRDTDALIRIPDLSRRILDDPVSAAPPRVVSVGSSVSVRNSPLSSAANTPTPRSPASLSTTSSIDSSRLPDTHIGSLPYAAPEILRPNPYNLDHLTDSWAVGVLLYTLVTLRLPYQHKFEPRLKLMIMNNDYDSGRFRAALGDFHATSKLCDILAACLQPDRALRWDMSRSALASMISSTVLANTSRYTTTGFFWPIRCTLSMACKSTCGFQSESNRTTESAAVRLIPRPPARVESRNTSASSAENRSISAWRSVWLVAPSIRHVL
ncbi:hypothetical protein OGAPHI_001044 [Ogataea philodendri]|uniref:Protein kinase domain-containing protein n=1 Tax=Ogataea philodendri TaxID=1378263 RepID=A0A9P8PFY7_9ASCO|nr:uncharacterized protein OGAPHI_001044 [Ogataea philodendri]KAH3670529.1 hypothetical protein OGAPHI_001044 [Ogataea philodendri]